MPITPLCCQQESVHHRHSVLSNGDEGVPRA